MLREVLQSEYTCVSGGIDVIRAIQRKAFCKEFSALETHKPIPTIFVASAQSCEVTSSAFEDD